jgi:hypothetical protein
MTNPWVLYRNVYIDVREFGLKQNADNFVKAGWKLLGIKAGFTEDNIPTLIYQVGWLLDSGEPVRPDIIDEAPLLQSQNFEP